jgi:ElaB/YqjD/DUF883 family membrane-anchored ribosome-binding protein
VSTSVTINHIPAMSDNFPTPTLDPEAGFTAAPSVAQAANDLRVAAGEKAREFVATANDQARGLKDRAVETAQHFRDVAAEKAQQLRAAAIEKAETLRVVAGEKATHIRESAAEHWQDTRVKAKEIHVSAEDYIRVHPTKCVLGALGVGFLIGLVVRR